MATKKYHNSPVKGRPYLTRRASRVIKTLIKEYTGTQKNLAEKLGVTQPLISAWATGSQRMPFEAAEIMYEIFNKDPRAKFLKHYSLRRLELSPDYLASEYDSDSFERTIREACANSESLPESLEFEEKILRPLYETYLERFVTANDSQKRKLLRGLEELAGGDTF